MCKSTQSHRVGCKFQLVRPSTDLIRNPYGNRGQRANSLPRVPEDIGAAADANVAFDKQDTGATIQSEDIDDDIPASSE